MDKLSDIAKFVGREKGPGEIDASRKPHSYITILSEITSTCNYMKKSGFTNWIAVIALAITSAVGACAQNSKSVSILGDSYSTFEGFIEPATNEMWYFQRGIVPYNQGVDQ